MLSLRSRDLVAFGRTRGNFWQIPGKLSGSQWGFCMVLNMNSVKSPGRFRGNTGLFRKIWDWGGFGHLAVSKGLCARPQIAIATLSGTENRTQTVFFSNFSGAPAWISRQIRTNHSNFRFARITRFARIVRIDSRESRH